MSNDKTTLADVQPGGRVRLGDQAERVRFEKWMTDVAKIIVGSSDPYPAGLERDYWRVWQAALSAQPSPAAAVPAGWKLVPIEPPWSMRNDGREFLIDGIEKEPERLAYFLWKTMINAAPEVP